MAVRLATLLLLVLAIAGCGGSSSQTSSPSCTSVPQSGSVSPAGQCLATAAPTSVPPPPTSVPPAPSGASSSPVAGTVVEDLTLTGPVSGHITAGTKPACTQGANNSGATVYSASWEASLQGSTYAFLLLIAPYAGPGPHPSEAVEFSFRASPPTPQGTQAPVDSTSFLLQPGGVVTVAADGKSGTVDSDYASTSTMSGHITGAWRCG